MGSTFPSTRDQRSGVVRGNNYAVPTAANAGLAAGTPTWSHFSLLLPFTAAAILSFYSLGNKNLWLDETVSTHIAGFDWPTMWKVMSTNDPNMGLYYVLLHFWLRLFGTGEFAVRSLSAIMAVASIVPVYAIGVRLFGARAGFLASSLLAVNSFFIHYAQETRSYTLFLLLAAATSYFFLKACGESSWKSWTLYSVTAALMVYAHFFGVLVIVAHCVSALAFDFRRPLRRDFILSHLLIACLVSPLMVPIVIPGIYTMNIGWLPKPSLNRLKDFVVELTGHGGPLLVLVYCAALIYGVYSAWTHWPRKGSVIWAFTFLITWLLLPVIASFLFSILLKPIFYPRYLFTSLPPLVLMAAAGLDDLQPFGLKLAGILLLLALSSRGLIDWYAGAGPFKREDWREATQYVTANSLPRDGIVFEPGMSRVPFEYYLLKLHPQDIAPKPVWPSAPWGRFSQSNFQDWPSSKRDEYSRLWRVFLYNSPSNADSRWLPRNSDSEYCLMRSQSFTYIQILLYSPCS